MVRHGSAAALLVALLVGCGGGGGGGAEPAGTSEAAGTPATTPATTGSDGDSGSSQPAAAATDKYVGTWVACRVGSPAASREQLTFSKVSATTLMVSATSQSATNPACTENLGAPTSSTGTVILVGTKDIGNQTLDKVFVTLSGTSSKEAMGITSDGKLVLGDVDKDADGYPAGLSPYLYTKQ